MCLKWLVSGHGEKTNGKERNVMTLGQSKDNSLRRVELSKIRVSKVLPSDVQINKTLVCRIRLYNIM